MIGRPPRSTPFPSPTLSRSPTMAMPSGRRNSDPAPPPIAIGKPPNSAAKVVIMIGRKRNRQASWIASRSEEHTSELQSPDLVCRLLLEKKKNTTLQERDAAH